MIQANVIAMSGRAVEAAGDVDVLSITTGTITLGNRQATAFMPADGVSHRKSWRMRRSSLRCPTRRLKAAASSSWRRKYNLRARYSGAGCDLLCRFTAQTRMSGVNLDGRQIRKGAADAIEAYVSERGGGFPAIVRDHVERIAKEGGTPLVVAMVVWA